MPDMKITSVVVDKLYPMVAKALDTNDAKFRKNIADFINKNHSIIFAEAPYDRLYFNQVDLDNMYKSLGFTEKDVENILENAYFWDIPINPQCVKEPYVEVLFCAIRYYLIKNRQKEAELTTIYLAFSGKFYASLHGLFFKKFPPSKYKSVMDFVVNNLTDKFDLKREGTVFGAIKAMCVTWLSTYGQKIKGKCDDDDIKGYLQQLRDREKSFFKNISKLYYEAYENRNYMNYETDNLDPDHFRLTENDAVIASRLTEVTMNYFTSSYVSLDICNKCKDENVKASEVKDIIECILGDNNNLPDVKKVINILICDFMRSCPHKKLSSVEFISYSIKAKPNTKDKYLLEMKAIVLRWLDENSPNYRKRKSRQSTAISYYKSIMKYFILNISKLAAKINV